MQTSNPALNPSIYQQARADITSQSQIMTVQGAASKSLFLLFLLILAAGWVWSQVFEVAIYGNQAVVSGAAVNGYLMGGAIGGLIVALVLTFKPILAAYLAPIYAVLEGLAIGAITAIAQSRFPGIPMQAAGLTFATLAVMLVAYRTKMIRPTEKFKAGMTAAIGGIFLVYLVSFILGLFSISVPFIHGSGPISIVFSLFVVVIAAFSLVLDFEAVEQGARARAPKYMEWYSAFALLVTLVWLYIEILKLLMKLANREE